MELNIIFLPLFAFISTTYCSFVLDLPNAIENAKRRFGKSKCKTKSPKTRKKIQFDKAKKKKSKQKQIQKKSKIKQQKTPKRAITYNMLFCFVFALEKMQQ